MFIPERKPSHSRDTQANLVGLDFSADDGTDSASTEWIYSRWANIAPVLDLVHTKFCGYIYFSELLVNLQEYQMLIFLRSSSEYFTCRRSMHQMYNVTLFLLFFMSLYGFWGVQFFGDELNYHCVLVTANER
ncbi:Sodium leak channel non-selective protein [Fasciolopsis buskii]|uniref:Sodium leak channel non-selective protein n=1 Tax=Fasciolopsis buskii TaxID=27845 RepID=A0A8E0S7J5_9TREM|nr:Sodium leak channel non-selective protein [Fasciolopsis buski]